MAVVLFVDEEGFIATRIELNDEHLHVIVCTNDGTTVFDEEDV